MTGSLERRLQLGMGIGLLLGFSLLFWGSSQAIRVLNEHYVVSRLGHDLDAALGAIRPAADRPLATLAARLPPVYSQPLSGHYLVLLEGSQVRFSSRSLWDEQLAVDPVPAGEQVQSRRDGPAGQQLLLVARGYRKAGHHYTLAVAEDITGMLQQIHRYQVTAALILAGLLFLLLAAQRYWLRSGFRKLELVREDVARVARGEARQLRDTVPDEIQPLVSEFNRLLGLLEQRLSRSRNALGNLAHALKAPLTLLRRILEQPEIDAATALQQADRIRSLVDRELRRARIAGSAGSTRQFNAETEVPPLLAMMQQLHPSRGLDIRSGPLPATALPLDREDMLELLGNLLDNACKWARHKVRLEICADTTSVTIHVEDDGPGIPGEQRQRLLARGSRLDETREGQGLGLAICSDIASLYGGRLRLEQSPALGGLRVSVELPLGDRSSGRPTNRAGQR